MANEQNLKRWGKELPCPTSEQAKKNGRLGGLTRAKNERERKTFAEYAEIALDCKAKNEDGEDINKKYEIIIKLVRNAVKGDIRAAELLMKLVGEMPNEKTELLGLGGTSLIPPIVNILPVEAINGNKHTDTE